MSIQITETGTEYLLTITVDQKERAKAIDGRRWDPERRVWVYPKTKKTYDALIAEFGDIISRKDAKILSAQALDTASKPDNSKELKAELQAIKDTLGSLKKSAESSLQKNSSETRSQQEIATLSAALANAKKDIEVERERYEQLEADLAAKDRKLREALAASVANSSPKPFMSLLIEHAKKTAQYNDEFIGILERCKIDGSLPIEVSKSLEKRLRKKLKTPEGNIFELLSEARDAELLSEEALDFAHTIRRQRNIVAHSDVSQEETLARILIVLFSSALLWPRLPK